MPPVLNVSVGARYHLFKRNDNATVFSFLDPVVGFDAGFVFAVGRFADVFGFEAEFFQQIDDGIHASSGEFGVKQVRA